MGLQHLPQKEWLKLAWNLNGESFDRASQYDEIPVVEVEQMILALKELREEERRAIENAKRH